MPSRWFRPSRTPAKRPPAPAAVPAPWYARDDGARLSHDRALVARGYPELDLRVDAERRRVTLEGHVVLKEATSGIPTRLATRIEFPPDYPAREPVAFEVGGRFPRGGDRHINEDDGSCCLWLPPKSKWNSADPDALEDFLNEVASFFERQLVYEASGQWPGSQWDHGLAGYAEFVLEQLDGSSAVLDVLATTGEPGPNARCPCGNGRKYKRCHSAAVARVEHAIGRRIYDLTLRYWRARSAPTANASGRKTTLRPTGDAGSDVATSTAEKEE